MRSFIKKDLLLCWRDRKEMLVVLLLPIILVVVLNFAFSGLFSGEEEEMDLQLAVVHLDDEESGWNQVKEKIVDNDAIGEEQKAAIIAQEKAFRPVSMLLDYLQSDEVGKWATVHMLSEDEAVRKVEEGEMDGMLLIPEGYTADSLYAAFTRESSTISLIYKLEKENIQTSVLYQMIEGFMDQMNVGVAIQQIGINENLDMRVPVGGIEETEGGNNFTIAQYFTITMAVLFALFLSGTVATKTGEEIRQKVFHRILLTDSRPVLFLTGKVVSSFLLVWLQIMFVFLVSHFLLGVFPERSASFWLGTVAIVTLFSIVVSGMTAVYTIIALKVKNTDILNGIVMFVILILGVLGGNFVPIYILPDWLKQIGEWTPNGQILVMFTQWVQFEDVTSLLFQSIVLLAFFFLCIVWSVAYYPNRGEAK
ncbi:ABC transporter permease [Alkalihalobacillus sp. LMS39]|uniref:ABC transporter permease n=1 Tax=Alkalihalobacillus sp. LMS39 TaxID=2924032 RepID=UPI001FB4AAB2|nr:ABC transporter permease [Alkalihalobacillus sp. LMS39]UOE95277.1 ABC transporter permease [Alkalihalobacillus sp. LMS39]